jgi:hypothetical protein
MKQEKATVKTATMDVVYLPVTSSSSFFKPKVKLRSSNLESHQKSRDSNRLK